ncbi:DUF58 domain-containing protein [Chloroflexia bacterium SDU3-3]|nr:DUF58 domain-containing protein [Chloroflexia bacterium SDU3-3]
MWFKTILRRRGAPASAAPRRGGPFRANEAMLRRLERLTVDASRSLQGNPNSGEHPSRHQLPMAIFSEHRPYSPGDDYRTVDWNAYARHEQVVVKLGEAEQDVDVHVLVDCSRSMDYGAPSKLVAAQQFAAAVGYIALAHSDRVRVTPFSAARLAGFGPAQGKGRAPELLRFIERLAPASATSLADVLRGYARQHERGGLLVICSDLLAAPADTLSEGLRSLTPPRWQVLVAHTLEAGELSPALGGLVDLEDAETGERIAVQLDEAALQQYRQNVERWQREIAEACGRYGASYVQVLADWPFERAVLPYLRLRRMVR